MFNKKAQEGGGAAAILVAIIALAILLYVLFLPPDIREDILGTGSDSGIGDEGVEDYLLLVENIGGLSVGGSTSMAHSMPTLNLFVKKEGVIIEDFGTIAIVKSVFNKNFKTLPFYLSNVANTENVILSFNAITSKGDLIVKVNGEEIFNDYVREAVNPIKVRSSLLEKANLLEFEVTSPSWRFWTSNKYELTEVVLRADVTDVSNQEAETIFYVDREEKSSLRMGELYFYPYCSEDAGTLIIKLNGNQVFKGLPSCGYSNRFELSPEQIVAGENALKFETVDGSYTITKLRYDSELNRKRDRTFSFDVDDDEFDSIINNNQDVYLKMTFPDDNRKEGRIYLNSNIKSFDFEDVVYELKVNNFIEEGINSLRITPEGSFDIDDIKVWIEE